MESITSRTDIPSRRVETGVTRGDLDKLAKELECGVAREEYNEAGQPVYVVYRIEEVKENGNGKEQTGEKELDSRCDKSRP